jgi:hypothetical protein
VIVRLKQLRIALKDEIWLFLDSFESFKPESASKIHFDHDKLLDTREITIDCISCENGDIVIYPRSKNRSPSSVSTMESIDDLFKVLQILEEKYGTKGD